MPGARIPIHSQAMRPLPSSMDPGPSPSCYKPYRLVLVVGPVMGGVGFWPTGFSRTANCLDAVGDGEIGPRTE